VVHAVRKFKIDVPQRTKYRVTADKSRASKEAYRKKYPNGRFGELASNWKGGRRNVGKNGRYIGIYMPDHPKCDSGGYVLEHRLEMEKKIGRLLTDEEIVHHKDGNGHNNKISNLELTTKKNHFKEHYEAVKEVKKLKKLLKQNGIPF
jgi:hypothetical protein